METRDNNTSVRGPDGLVEHPKTAPDQDLVHTAQCPLNTEAGDQLDASLAGRKCLLTIRSIPHENTGPGCQPEIDASEVA